MEDELRELVNNPSRILKAIMDDMKPNDPRREHYNYVIRDLVKEELKEIS